MKRIFSALFVLLLCLIPLNASAAGVVDFMPDFYVADYANVLDDQTEGLIVLNNDLLDKACGAQIVVVTVDEVSSVSGIESYAYTLFNQWGIGDKSKNNGLLLLIAVNEGSYWLMAGKGLQDYITAGDLDAMALEYFEPSAAAGNFDEAVRQIFGACFDKMAIAYNVKLSVDDSLYYKWIQGGQKSEDGSRFLSRPLKTKAETQPAVQQVTPTQHPVQKPVSEKKGGGFPIVPVLLIAAVIGVVFVMSKSRKTPPAVRTPAPPPAPVRKPQGNPYRTPVKTTRPPTGSVTRPPMNPPRPPMGGASRPAAPRTGGASRPPMGNVTRPPMGGASRPAAPRTGGSTRGSGTGGSFSAPRPSGSPTSRPSSSGFGGNRSGGGGSTRGGGTGGSFR